MKVIVVGAGLAGLACAVELADNGYEVEVLEKRPVLGGRVSSWLDKDGDWVETAPHVIRGSYKSLLALMERVGIADRIQWKKQQLVYASKGGKISSITFSPSAPDTVRNPDYGSTLEHQTLKGGISRSAPCRLASTLQSLPPILHIKAQCSVSSYSKDPVKLHCSLVLSLSLFCAG